MRQLRVCARCRVRHYINVDAPPRFLRTSGMSSRAAILAASVRTSAGGAPGGGCSGCAAAERVGRGLAESMLSRTPAVLCRVACVASR